MLSEQQHCLRSELEFQLASLFVHVFNQKSLRNRTQYLYVTIMDAARPAASASMLARAYIMQ